MEVVSLVIGAPEGVYGMVRDLSPLVKLLTPGGTESHAALTKAGGGIVHVQLG